ncbi:MAG: GNAT family N-acetyltransferase [Parasphingorhabdus sp.]|uniref:GNAT family N-acetyltransferase n=1 Tax=Parasphingorhabdus sp. TaxID=2709688 RepID=UPI00329823CA
MSEPNTQILAYHPDHLDEIRALTLRAWDPVFPKMEKEMPAYIYNLFYPDGWQNRQIHDVEAVCRENDTEIWIAQTRGVLSGYIGLRSHIEDSMGEIYIIAVDPEYQQQGVGSALMAFAFHWMQEKGLAMAMVETGGDQGHAPSRAAYEKAGFERYPVARYFKKL